MEENLISQIELQPTINIGVIGSVSNGKSTIVEKITKTKTQKHSKEIEKNMTIKLGYANAKIYKCADCPAPQCYQSYQSDVFEAKCKHCDKIMDLQKHISLLDSPGHNLLLATMLNGTCIMDTAIIVESFANITIPNQQTQEHLIATSLKKIPIAFTCINKADLVKKQMAINKIKEIDDYLTNKDINKPIIPLSANKEINIDVICEYICTKIPEIPRILNTYAKMIVIRSFNVNKPNCKFNELIGGVVGGSITKGRFTVGDNVKILPGLVKNNSYEPIYTKIISINSENIQLQTAYPSGLIGICLDIDPALTAKDNMVGQIILGCDPIDQNNNYGHSIFNELTIEIQPINTRYKNLKIKDHIQINCNGTNMLANIIKIKDKFMRLALNQLICIKKDSKITISNKIGNENIENACGVILGSGRVINGKIN